MVKNKGQNQRAKGDYGTFVTLSPTHERRWRRKEVGGPDCFKAGHQVPLQAWSSLVAVCGRLRVPRRPRGSGGVIGSEVQDIFRFDPHSD